VVELLPGPIENQPSVINVNDYLDLPAAELTNVQISIANNVDAIHLAPSEPVFGSIVVRAEDSFLVALAKDNSTHYFNVRRAQRSMSYGHLLASLHCRAVAAAFDPRPDVAGFGVSIAATATPSDRALPG
jgi:hypothetical protein